MTGTDSPLDELGAMSWAERAGIVLGALGLLAGFLLVIAVVVIAGAAMGGGS